MPGRDFLRPVFCWRKGWRDQDARVEAKDYRPETRLVHAGTLRSQFGETSEALFLTQGYVYQSAEECEARFSGKTPGYVYSRYSNPTVSMFEQRMAALEGAEAARATATGMAAVTTALMGLVRAGDHVVAAKALFGSCRWVIEEWLPRFGVASTLVDGTDLDAWKKAVRKNTKAFFLETPTNPTLEVIDIAAVAEIAHSAGAKLVVDNVFATPLYQSRSTLGADCVVYSATKHIDGQGRVLGGVILGSREVHHRPRPPVPAADRPVAVAVQRLGAAEGPGDPAGARAARRPTPPARSPTRSPATRRSARLIYPGRADHPQADIVAQADEGRLDALSRSRSRAARRAPSASSMRCKLIGISNNLGDAKSLITHPTTTTHQRLTPEQRAELGIGDGLVRLSAGLEHPDDLIEDLLTALGRRRSRRKRCRRRMPTDSTGRGRGFGDRMRRGPWPRRRSSSRSCAARRATRTPSKGM